MNEIIWLLAGVLICAFVFWPMVKILRRLGLHPAWMALAMIPIAALILLWFLSYAKWPGNAQVTIIR